MRKYAKYATYRGSNFEIVYFEVLLLLSFYNIVLLLAK